MAKVDLLIVLGAVLIAVGGEIAESHHNGLWLTGRIIIIGAGMFFIFRAGVLEERNA